MAFGGTAGAAVKTLYVSLPGPLDACSSLSVGASDTSVAIGDLLYPSAFLNGPNDALVGTGAAIVSAELTSVNPESVTYSVAPQLKWSDGTDFNATSLVQWWTRAKAQPSISSDGYRAISSMTVSSDGLSVVAKFSQSFSNWNVLFRDVLSRNSSLDCSIKNLEHRPTLGYYSVTSATKHQIVLRKSGLLHKGVMRFGRVVISDTMSTSKVPSKSFIGEMVSVNSQDVSLLTSDPRLTTSLTSSSSLTQMSFSSVRPNVSLLAFRQALSVAINRQLMVNFLWGTTTTTVRVANRLLTPATSAVGSANLDAPQDCLTCALEALKSIGYSQAGSSWHSPHGNTVAIRMTVGPSGADRSAAAFIINTWRVIGIPTFRVTASSEQLAAASLRSGAADVAVYSRSLAFGPSVVARAYFGSPVLDSYAVGPRNPLWAQTALAVTQVFNDAQASQQWALFDAQVTHSFISRPLFCAPVIQAWSRRFSTVRGGSSVIALVDQLPGLRP